MKNLWFQLDTETLNDPKVQKLPAETFRVWINLLCIAREAEEAEERPDLESVAFALRMSESEASKHIKILQDRRVHLQEGVSYPDII